jgi:hypothetical protein
MLLAERPDLAAEVTLLVDVGTNAEIVLGNHDRVLACSSPTGPHSKAHRSAAVNAPRPGPSSAYASIRSRWSRVTE